MIVSDSPPAILPHIGPKTINSKRFPLNFSLFALEDRLIFPLLAISGCFLLGDYDYIDLIGSPRNDPIGHLSDIVKRIFNAFSFCCITHLVSIKGKWAIQLHRQMSRLPRWTTHRFSCFRWVGVERNQFCCLFAVGNHHGFP